MDEPLPRKEPVIVVMGIAGTGKTTVGRCLAATLGWEFLDGDDLHPAANVAKMARGVPLTDQDRAPWLERVRERIARHLARAEPVRSSPARLLSAGTARGCASTPRVCTLSTSRATRRYCARLAARAGHYMKAGMLDSQLAALEPPRRALAIDAALPVEVIVARIRSVIGR